MFESSFAKYRMMFIFGMLGFLIFVVSLFVCIEEIEYIIRGNVTEGTIINTEKFTETVRNRRFGSKEEERLRITYIFSIPDNPNYEYEFQNIIYDGTIYRLGDKVEVQYYRKSPDDRGLDVEGRVTGTGPRNAAFIFCGFSFFGTIALLAFMFFIPVKKKKKQTVSKKSKSSSMKKKKIRPQEF